MSGPSERGEGGMGGRGVWWGVGGGGGGGCWWGVVRAGGVGGGGVSAGGGDEWKVARFARVSPAMGRDSSGSMTCFVH